MSILSNKMSNILLKLYNVEKAGFPGNKHWPARQPNNCIKRFLINSSLPNKSQSRGTFIPLHFPIKMLFLGGSGPAEKPSNDQESSLQNTVTKKNDVLHQSEMVLRWAGICFQDLCLFKSYTAEKSLD